MLLHEPYDFLDLSSDPKPVELQDLAVGQLVGLGDLLIMLLEANVLLLRGILRFKDDFYSIER